MIMRLIIVIMMMSKKAMSSADARLDGSEKSTTYPSLSLYLLFR